MPGRLTSSLGSTLRSPVLARFGLQLGAQIGSAACGFAMTLIMVRSLGVSGFGAAALGISILTYALVIINFGADVYATQNTAKDHGALQRDLAAVTTIRAVMMLPTLLAIGIALSFAGWDGETQLAVALFSVSLIVSIAYPLWAMQALERNDAVSLCLLGGQILNLILTLVAAKLNAGIVGFALARIASDVVLALALSLWVRRRFNVAAVRFSISDALPVLRLAAPLGVSQVLRSLALGSDLLILSFFVGAVALGLYAVPLRLFLLALSLSSVYFAVVLPTFARSARDSAPGLRHTLRRFLWLPMPLLIAAIALGVVFAGPLLGLLFGPDFIPGAPVLQLLLVASGVNFVNRAYRCVVVVGGKLGQDMGSTIIATSLNLITKLVCIPLLGIAGAAIGTLVGEVALAVLQGRIAKQVTG